MIVMSVFNRNRNKPKVIINDIELKNEIGRWLGVNRNIINVFSKLLLNVGFKVEDEIILYKYFYKEDDYLLFNYIVNGKNPYKKNVIMLEYGREGKKPRISVNTGSKNTRSKVAYEVDRKLDNYKIISKSLEDKRYGMLNRRYFEDRVLFFVEKNDYELSLCVDSPDCGIYYGNIYNLNNENELIKYLCSLTFPVKIDEVYKKICDISLGDTSEYSYVSLKVTKYDLVDGLDEVTDEITLRNGLLENFIITKNNKTIRIDENDNYWIYEKKMDDGTLLVSYNRKDDKYIQGIVDDDRLGNSGKSVGDDLVDVGGNAIKDVEDTKKLVRVMLNRGDDIYDR